MSTAEPYKIGKDAPPIEVDEGSGVWCSSPTPKSRWAQIQLLGLNKLLASDTGRRLYSPEAIANLQHFTGNTGETLHVHLRELMERSYVLRRYHDEELATAKAFTEKLPPGVHHITSSEVRWGILTDHLHKAFGGFKFWGQAVVSVDKVEASRKQMRIWFDFHFFDRYNWDRKKNTDVTTPWDDMLGRQATKIADERLAEYHRQCLAMDYDIKGKTTTTVTWEVAASKDNGPYVPRAATPPATPLPNPFKLLTG